jgi:hypothetical protein
LNDLKFKKPIGDEESVLIAPQERLARAVYKHRYYFHQENTMANRKQHAVLGFTAGVGGYALHSYIKEEKTSLPELFGAGLSGVAGAFLPDIIEPATNPNHRSFFHSVSFVGVAGPPAWSYAWRVKDEQIRQAEDCEVRANAMQDGFEKILWKLRALLHRLLAGLLPGLVLGYASHLAADAITPMGLPFLG